jgi:carbamoyltransferase
MPFAPSILWERREDYAILHRDTGSYYMTMAYDSTPKAREHLIAALHPYDFTMRPQFVKEDHNPKYYKLLTEFKALTGIGGVLNTSFNLHGWPIICSPQDAVRTLVNSGLDYVTINNYIIWKKSDLPVGLRSAP